MRSIVSILLSPWSQIKMSIHSVFCRKATSDQARPNLLNLTAYRILDTEYSNWDIIGTAISFLSNVHFRNICYLINQHPYQYPVFIVIPFSVLARQWICLWSCHHFYISIDVFEAWWIKGGILPHLNFAVLATRYDDFILTLCGSVNKTKLMDKLTSSSGNTERMIPVWQFFQSEWRTQFPIDSVGGLELDKPGGVINAASPLNNIKLMRMNGKQSLLVRSHV